MSMKDEKALRELLHLPLIRLDRKLRNLLEALLEKLQDIPTSLRDLIDTDPLPIEKENLLDDLTDLNHLRRLRMRLEDRIESLLDELVSLLEQLRRHRKDNKKCPPHDRKRLIKIDPLLVKFT
ncbi:MAG: bifunctional adenosylcobinamide kinase/adenosylcobinamide-phosphate guanylyltransferase [Bacillus sp. (in: Bacteria)]|nr:bifunctional adenosylcobinamide kinase/adenosylcobinamide-phosphate guanylyltransferase [Bacillus sp. (in: firmicutes)]